MLDQKALEDFTDIYPYIFYELHAWGRLICQSQGFLIRTRLINVADQKPLTWEDGGAYAYMYIALLLFDIYIFMIFNLYYISCTYVKPMNCMVLGNKQYNTHN